MYKILHGSENVPEGVFFTGSWSIRDMGGGGQRTEFKTFIELSYDPNHDD